METLISNGKFKPVAHFLIFFGVNVIIFVVAFGSLMDVLPPRLDWITKIVFPACVVCGFISSAVSTKKSEELLLSKEEIIPNLKITAIGFLVLLFLYISSFALKPTQYITVEQFQNAGLNANQVSQLQEYLNAQGYISIDNMDNINLSLEQKNAVIKVLNSLGYTTRGDVESISKGIARTEIALVATQTAVARATSCNITPDAGVPQVSIRKSNSSDSDYIGALIQGSNLYVVGHDGGTVNQDRWWLIEQSIGGETSYGWVASWYVKEINEVECMRVQQAPGSD